MGSKGYAEIWGAIKVYCGRCGNGQWPMANDPSPPVSGWIAGGTLG